MCGLFKPVDPNRSTLIVLTSLLSSLLSFKFVEFDYELCLLNNPKIVLIFRALAFNGSEYLGL